jgi:hypothetical protein
MTRDALDELISELAARIATELAQLQPTQAQAETTASRWMSIHAAATYLDSPRQRLYKLTAAAAIPHYKHEGRTRMSIPGDQRVRVTRMSICDDLLAGDQGFA